MSAVSASSTPPYYFYDPHLGSPRDPYTRTDYRRTRKHLPEAGGRLVAVVEGEVPNPAFWGPRTIKWRAEPGTPVMILGHWPDGTVHLKWPGLPNNYMLDGRFPAWVVKEDPTVDLAGGGFMLRANELLPVTPEVSRRLFLIIAVLVIVILLLLWPTSREALMAALRLGS
jgi:hypothetical protein